MYDELAANSIVTKVTRETSDDDLRNMDKKKDGFYPVYLISEEYGSRGLDYRAPENEFGICMLICGTFVNMRSRI